MPVITVAGEALDLCFRSGWGARSVDLQAKIGNNGPPEPRGYLHHEGGSLRVGKVLTVDQEKAVMRALEQWAIDGKGYTTIDYGWVVMPSGRCYEGRGFRVRPAATLDENNESETVCLAGNYDKERPTSAALNSAALLFRMAVDDGELGRNPGIRGHRESVDHPGATSCPGVNVDMDAFRALVTHKLAWAPPAPTPNPPLEEDYTVRLVRTNHPHYPVECIVQLDGNLATRLEPGPYARLASNGQAPPHPSGVPFEDWKTLAADFTFVLSPL